MVFDPGPDFCKGDPVFLIGDSDGEIFFFPVVRLDFKTVDPQKGFKSRIGRPFVGAVKWMVLDQALEERRRLFEKRRIGVFAEGGLPGPVHGAV